MSGILVPASVVREHERRRTAHTVPFRPALWDLRHADPDLFEHLNPDVVSAGALWEDAIDWAVGHQDVPLTGVFPGQAVRAAAA